MKEQIIDKNKQLENAEEQLRRAQANLAEAKRKQNADKRKAENHHKYIMGGICVKYLADAYLYEEQELDQILSSAIHSRECQNAISKIRSHSEGKARPQPTEVQQSDVNSFESVERKYNVDFAVKKTGRQNRRSIFYSRERATVSLHRYARCFIIYVTKI